MRNLFFSKFIFITFFIITTSSEFISFNLKYFKTTNPSTSYLYTILKLGDPESNIYTYISTKNPLFSMMKINKKLDENESLEYYNISSSRTFKNVSNLYVKFVTSEKDIYAQEKIKLNYYNNETKKYREISVNNIDFVMGISLSEITGQIYFMNIGFSVMLSNTINDKFNFILQLKGKNIIKSYDWFILYNNIDLNENELLNFENIQNINATLIIGGLPHFYNSEKFFKSQILTEYSEIFAWTMKFKDVYLYIDDKITRKQKKISTNLDIVQIYLDDISIYAPSYFTNLIKREYFSRYVSCYFSKEGEYVKYYCEKSEFFTIDDLKSFPTLYFQHIEFNYTFELSYQDLFIEYGNRYYFLIKESKVENWVIGFPLLKKYQFFFNQDYKTIGFYNPNLPKDEGKEGDKDKERKEDKEVDDSVKEKNKTHDNPNKENIEGSMSTKTVIFIVVITGIVFISIGIIIGKLIFKKLEKRLRANELVDNYDYISSENNNIN